MESPFHNNVKPLSKVQHVEDPLTLAVGSPLRYIVNHFSNIHKGKERRFSKRPVHKRNASQEYFIHSISEITLYLYHSIQISFNIYAVINLKTN